MKKSITLMAVCLCSYLHCLSQSNSAETQSTMRSMADGDGMFRSFDNRKKETEGSHMIFKEHVPGQITMNDGQRVPFTRMNYDGNLDVIVVVRKDEEKEVNTSRVKSFYVVQADDTLRFERMVRPDNKIGFFQRITTGSHLTLYKRHFTNVTPPTYSGAYSTGSTNGEIEHLSSFYVSRNATRPVEFKNRKSLLALFPGNEEPISQFIKQHKTDFKRDEDLRMLIEYIDALQAGRPTN